MAMKSWDNKNPKKPTLIDGVKMNKDHPTTFLIPSAQEIAGLKVGDHIKVGTFAGIRAERFWVELQVIEPERFVGRIDSDLNFTQHGLRCDDIIECEPRHILSLLKGN